MILNKFSKRFQKNRFPFLQKLQRHETELFFKSYLRGIF